MSRIDTAQNGFTIVELMIATTILSTILVLVTGVMINIGNLYSKGIHQSEVQGAVRNINTDLTQNIQLTDQKPKQAPAVTSGGVSWGAVCVGYVRYTYVTGIKLSDQKRDVNNANPTGPVFNHVLWRDKIASSTCSAANLPAASPSTASLPTFPVSGIDGRELMPDGTRLTFFAVLPISDSTSRIEVGVAYGDNDLMNISAASPLATTCKGSQSDQFCATAGLTTLAVRRIQGQQN